MATWVGYVQYELYCYTTRPLKPHFGSTIESGIYHGINKGRSSANLKDTMKLADLENPQCGTMNLGHISYTWPSCSHFCVQIPHFFVKENFTKSRFPLL